MSGAKENVCKQEPNNASAFSASTSAKVGGGGRTSDSAIEGGGGQSGGSRSPHSAGGSNGGSKKNGPQKRKKTPSPFEPDSTVWAVFVRDNTLRKAVILARDLVHKPEGYTKKSCNEVSVWCGVLQLQQRQQAASQIVVLENRA